MDGDLPERPSRDFERFLEPERKTLLRMVPAVVSAVLAVLTIAGIILLRPTSGERPSLSEIGVASQVFEAVVDAVDEGACSYAPDDPTISCATATFRLTQGPDVGRLVVQEYTIGDTTPRFAVGERVVMDYDPNVSEEYQYRYYDRQRRGVLLWVTVLFVLVVIGLGRWRGLAALVGLAASVVILLLFIVPAIIDGRSPVLVALVGASAIAYVALYVAHGFNRMTTVALLGTLAALALTLLLSWVALAAARLSGFAAEESFILTLAGEIDVGGLILAGVVLGSMGALDDVSVTQASAVWELKLAAPELGWRELFVRSLRVGRDHIASMVNTLLLAYAGAAMPLLLFFVLSNQSLGTVMNTEVVATEVLRTLLGSIGLVAAVPATSWLAAVSAADIHPDELHRH
ncbi:MAG: YibE/F family protein [Actinobacteria bacterium]|nr:YibE/F family protein [Actinomycetota bacterium]